MNNEIAGISN